jgi:cytochrome oxidase assembly protein ShyY1
MRFKPSMLSTLVIGSLCLGFGGLAAWQLERAGQKTNLLADCDAAARLQSLDRAISVDRFTRARLKGSFLAGRHFLIDNRVHAGRPGVHVLTPFTETDTGVTVLVNRGWLPMRPDRSALPEISEPAQALTISGHLDGLRKPAAVLGEPDQPVQGNWPQLLTYPDMDSMSSALDLELYPLVLYLADDQPGGFDGRDWTPFVMTPAKHRAYAFQWAALTVTGVVAWVLLGVNRARGSAT